MERHPHRWKACTPRRHGRRRRRVVLHPADHPSVLLIGSPLRVDESLRHLDAYTGSLFATQRVASYADLVGSRPLAERVSDSLGGSLDPDDLTGAVTAKVIPETVILEINATDPDPQMARDITQAYARALSDLVDDIETPNGKADP